MTGAKVLYSEGWAPANEHEIPTARALASNGIDVVLRDRVNETAGDHSTSGIKSADALLNMNGLWQPFDFKAINDATTNLKTAAQRMARSARKQGGSAVIFLARNLSAAESVSEINNGIRVAITFDRPPMLKMLILVAPDGKMQVKDIEDFYGAGNGFSEFR